MSTEICGCTMEFDGEANIWDLKQIVNVGVEIRINLKENQHEEAIFCINIKLRP